jgi:hypothetical protein
MGILRVAPSPEQGTSQRTLSYWNFCLTDPTLLV